MDEFEENLAGGNVSESVVRVGKTVRKPWLKNTQRMLDYLKGLRLAGIDVPRPLGRDEQGRYIVDFVEGSLALDLSPLGSEELSRVGRLIRRIHDASPRISIGVANDWDLLLPAENADLMCHNDLAPWNLIMGERWVFIDWDAAGPSTRLWDLAYAAQSFAELYEGQPVDACAHRLRAFIDGYDADDSLREALPLAMAQRTEAMYNLLKTSHESELQPWADMYVAGHGEHWRAASNYVLLNQQSWKKALARP